MSDLEWYLDVGGKQSGPHSAKEIVEMVRGGVIPATSQVTAARLNGDWVTAQDLIDAYDELYTKPVIAIPISPSSEGTALAAAPSPVDPNFTAPPRPTEQLEKSKIITLNRAELEKTPDPTEALFQAIQAVREKANLKNTVAPSATASATRDSFGQLSRPTGTRVPPQLILILTLAAIFGLTVYGVIRMVGGKNSEEAAKPAPNVRKNSEAAPPPTPPRSSAGGLLNDQGGGTSAARTTPPVRPRAMTGRSTEEPAPQRDERLMNRNTGGARYRDERDAPVEDEPDVDESDIEAPREAPEPMPVDPSQVPADRIIPEPGTIPGRGPLPGADPYIPPVAPVGNPQ